MSAVSVRAGAGDLEASITLSVPRAKKARNLPSGDQKGKSPPSVPGTGYGSGESRSWIHSRVAPSASRVPKTSRFSSGAIMAGAEFAP